MKHFESEKFWYLIYNHFENGYRLNNQTFLV